ncbi:unnamed protein product [Rhizoctonia solani]|uniref:Cyanovirin-N domain-containing protein n=1 Tax=Rhizoctonia solani TaxID=456999 RepID=A0A8H3DW36_9AGAM|nr:unnamed protein product [Rhizoctonia solani]
MGFLAFCQIHSIRLSDTHTLTANLKKRNGEWHVADLDLDDSIGNVDGKFVWGGTGYSHTATNISLSVLDSPPPRLCLYAALKKSDGTYEEAGIDLDEGISSRNGEFIPRFLPECKTTPVPPRALAPIDPHNNEKQLEQAKGTITTLPPHNPLCTAFVAIFTEPNGRQLRFTACPIIAVPTFSANVRLCYDEIAQVSGMRSFGGSVCKKKISLYLDNGVRIEGEVASGGPDAKATIAGSGHWGMSS